MIPYLKISCLYFKRISATCKQLDINQNVYISLINQLYKKTTWETYFGLKGVHSLLWDAGQFFNVNEIQRPLHFGNSRYFELSFGVLLEHSKHLLDKGENENNSRYMYRPKKKKYGAYFGKVSEDSSIIWVQRTFVRGLGHVIKGNVNSFDLIPRGTERSLKGGNIVKFSLLIHHPKYNIEISKKWQEGMWKDQVKSHFNSSLAREDGDLDWDEN